MKHHQHPASKEKKKKSKSYFCLLCHRKWYLQHSLQIKNSLRYKNECIFHPCSGGNYPAFAITHGCAGKWLHVQNVTYLWINLKIQAKNPTKSRADPYGIYTLQKAHIYTPPNLSKASPSSSLKQFQCWSD